MYLSEYPVLRCLIKVEYLGKKCYVVQIMKFQNTFAVDGEMV